MEARVSEMDSTEAGVQDDEVQDMDFPANLHSTETARCSERIRYGGHSGRLATLACLGGHRQD